MHDCLLAYIAQSDDATVPMEGTGEADEMEPKVSELEAKVKDLERKVADLFMDNVALKTKLEASRKVEKQQQEEITSLKERLVQTLRAQVSMYFYSLCFFACKRLLRWQQCIAHDLPIFALPQFAQKPVVFSTLCIVATIAEMPISVGSPGPDGESHEEV